MVDAGAAMGAEVDFFRMFGFVWRALRGGELLGLPQIGCLTTGAENDGWLRQVVAFLCDDYDLLCSVFDV